MNNFVHESMINKRDEKIVNLGRMIKRKDKDIQQFGIRIDEHRKKAVKDRNTIKILENEKKKLKSMIRDEKSLDHTIQENNALEVELEKRRDILDKKECRMISQIVKKDEYIFDLKKELLELAGCMEHWKRTAYHRLKKLGENGDKNEICACK